MFLFFLVALGALSRFALAQGPAAVVCLPGQCIQGFSNLTLGAKISASQSPLPLLLLPGQYTTTTNPQLLHDVLTSSSMSISASAGFNSSEKSLPMNLAIQPGIILHSSKLYGGQSAFQEIPSSPIGVNSSASLNSPGSIALAQNVYGSIGSSASSRIVLWESVPDMSQLPSQLSGNISSLKLYQLQSSQCSPPCSSAGICSSSGTCTCQPNFTGSSCEECASGFFGSKCTACPSGCSNCDQGITGSGRCLDNETQANSTSTTTVTCSDGFFKASTGECKVCSIGCTKCSDTTGECLSCESSFSLDANDKTKCNPPQSTDNTGAICPDGSFGNGSSSCTPCDSACKTCTGSTNNDCVECADGTYLFSGKCVSADSKGVCQTGSSTAMFADNNKKQCDSCPVNCGSCEIPNFTKASTSNQVQCTACSSGAFLYQNKCVDSCPSGTFADGSECKTCDSSCSTCSGSATFCLTCPSSKLAFNGTCVSSCPSGSSQNSGSNSCFACHPDCATCSGSSFSQCSSCPSSNPILSSGRCLSTCSKGDYFDVTSNSCKSCDSSCSSCSGPSSSECLACSSSAQVLRSGKCVEAPCSTDGTGGSVLSGLGVCLSELVTVPKASGTSSATPLPSITGLDNPTTQPSQSKQKLTWWQILLMALGCAFIFFVIILLWRRRMRKKRQWETRVFAKKRNLGQGWGWNGLKLGWLGLLGRNKSRKVKLEGQERDMHLKEIKRVSTVPSYHYHDEDVEQARKVQHEDEKMNIFDSYYRQSGFYATPSSRGPSSNHLRPAVRADDRLTRSSMYSELTGRPRNTPEPRQPVKERELRIDTHATGLSSRSPTWRNSHTSSQSTDTFIRSPDSDSSTHHEPEPLINLSSTQTTWQPQPSFLRSRSPSPCPSPAQEYASAVKPALAASPPLPGTLHWLSTLQPEPQYPVYNSHSQLMEQPTGGSAYTSYSSRNPFRRN